MESQVNKYKDSIIEVLLKRIIPLEKQLEAQSEIIKEMTQSIESLTILLTADEVSIPIKPSQNNKESKQKPTLPKIEELKPKEDSQKAADLQEVKKTFTASVERLKGAQTADEKAESLKAGEPESEIEDELEIEEELQIIDIELSQLGDFENSEVPEFYYNDLALGAIGSLAAMTKSELQLSSPPPKIKWILRLFWAVQGKEYNQDQAAEAWNKFIEGNFSKLDAVFFQMRLSFNFSMENLDKIEVLLNRRKGLLDPVLFGYCIVGYHLMAIVKNVIEHSGVIPAASGSRFKRLVYKKEKERY